MAGEYRVRNVRVGDEPLDLQQIYRVCSLDFTMLDHGDGHSAFDGGKVIWRYEDQDCEGLAYEAVVSYISDILGGLVYEGYETPYGQERIVAVSSAE